MEDDEYQLVEKILASMVEQAEGDLDDKEVENLGILIRLCVQFYNFLTARGRWPVFPDPFHNMTYEVDSILWNVDSFLQLIRHTYGIMRGRTRTTVDWNAVSAQSLKDQYLSLYQEFIAETDFLKRFRLVLDLYKLQLVFAGIFYDCDERGYDPPGFFERFGEG